MNKGEISAKIAKGGYFCRVVVEILGAPASLIEKTMEKTVELIGKNPHIDVLKAKVFEPKEEPEEKLWSSFADMELLFKDLSVLTGFCFDFMPSSVEVIEPRELNFSALDFSAWLNEIQARLHTIDRRLKEQNAGFKVTEANLFQVIRYSILHAAKKPITAEKIREQVGIDQRSCDLFLDKLVARAELVKEKGKFKTNSKVVFTDDSNKKN